MGVGFDLASYSDKIIRHMFYDVGRFNARFPLVVVGIMCVVSGFFVSGLYRANDLQENDIEDLWAPTHSTAQSDRKKNRDLFGVDVKYAKVIVEPVNKTENILSYNYIQLLYDLETAIRKVHVNGKSYDNICQTLYKHPREYNPCNLHSVMMLWNSSMETVPKEQKEIIKDISKGKPAFLLDSVIGGINREHSGAVVSAKAFMSTFYLNSREDHKNWQKSFISTVENIAKDPKFSQYFEVYQLTSISTSEEISRGSEGTLFLAGMSVLLCTGYICISFSKTDVVKSNVSLAFGGMIVLVMSYFSGVGFSFWMGLKFTPISCISVFFLLGIGIGNYILLVETWNFADPAFSIEIRNGHAMMNSGVVLILTNWCTILAFLLCSNSAFPAVFHFSMSTGLILIFNFIYTITIFNALMVLSFRRMKSGRMDCMPCHTTNRPFHLDFGDDFLQQDIDLAALVARFYIAPYIVQVAFKIFTVVAFVVLVGLSIYGTTLLEEELDLRDVVPDNSYSTTFYRKSIEHFPKCGAKVSAIFGEMEYRLSETKSRMKLFQDELRNQPYVANHEVLSIWNYYDYWLEQKGINSTFYTEKDYLIHLRAFFTDKSLGDFGHFEYDVVFEENSYGEYISVISSRITTNHVAQLVYSSDLMKAVDTTRQLCKDFQMDLPGVFPYADEYIIWDSFRIVTKELLLNMLITFFCSFCLMLSLLHVWISILVLILTAATTVIALSWLPLCGLKLNSISVVCIIFSVGLVAAYSTYIAYAFQTNKGNRNLRSTMAVEMMGRPVISAALATFFGVVLLIASNTEIYRLFFKTLSGIIFIALLNGLITLPVILSFLGPKLHDEIDTTSANPYEREILLEDRDDSSNYIFA